MNQKERIYYLKELFSKRRKRAQYESYIFFFLSVLVVLISIVLFWLSPTIASKELYGKDDIKLEKLKESERAVNAEIALIIEKEQKQKNIIEQQNSLSKPKTDEIYKVSKDVYEIALDYDGFENKAKSGIDPNYTIKNSPFAKTPYISTGEFKLYFNDEPSASQFVEMHVTEEMRKVVSEYMEKKYAYNELIKNSLESDSKLKELIAEKKNLLTEQSSISSQITSIRNPYGFRDVNDLESVVAYSKMIRDTQSNAFLVHSNITRYGTAILGIILVSLFYSRYRVCVQNAEHNAAIYSALVLYESDLIREKNPELLRVFFQQIGVPSFLPNIKIPGGLSIGDSE